MKTKKKKKNKNHKRITEQEMTIELRMVMRTHNSSNSILHSRINNNNSFPLKITLLITTAMSLSNSKYLVLRRQNRLLILSLSSKNHRVIVIILLKFWKSMLTYKAAKCRFRIRNRSNNKLNNSLIMMLSRRIQIM